MTDFIVGQFIGGQALFYGTALCLLGCFLVAYCGKKWILKLARVTVLAGAVFVVLSAAPFPFWVYGMFFGLLSWAVLWPGKGDGNTRTRMRFLPLLLLVLQALGMVCTEIWFSMPPKIPIAKASAVFVVGDSISMGADPPGKNWPECLGELAGLKVRNFSFGGAKLESALDNARRIDQDDALVILEIGGNDLLGGTSIEKFREDLEKMTTLACGARRRVVMVELPLPPFYNRYGMVQRSVAKKHGVTLIPKRFIAKVISTPGATSDGLHFSNAGHVLFARALNELLVP